ncbi:hypothetical protein ABXK73_02315 [Campylobacter jejuni]
MQNLVDNTDKYQEQALKSLKNTKMGALNNEFKKLGDSTNTALLQNLVPVWQILVQA